jgi:hypothetical protein
MKLKEIKIKDNKGNLHELGSLSKNQLIKLYLMSRIEIFKLRAQLQEKEPRELDDK